MLMWFVREPRDSSSGDIYGILPESEPALARRRTRSPPSDMVVLRSRRVVRGAAILALAIAAAWPRRLDLVRERDVASREDERDRFDCASREDVAAPKPVGASASSASEPVRDRMMKEPTSSSSEFASKATITTHSAGVATDIAVGLRSETSNGAFSSIASSEKPSLRRDASDARSDADADESESEREAMASERNEAEGIRNEDPPAADVRDRYVDSPPMNVSKNEATPGEKTEPESGADGSRKNRFRFDVSGAPSRESPQDESLSVERAVAEFEERVERARPGSFERDARCRDEYRRVDTSRLSEYLEADAVAYPSDAEAHFNEIRLATSKYAQHGRHSYHMAAGYAGPWVENEFVHRQERRYEMAQSVDDFCLPDLFGPFIPILIPWTDVLINDEFTMYPEELVRTLTGLLRPNTPYLVVVQCALGLGDGVSLTAEMQRAMNWTVTVLSAGGYGHVPIPLVKGDLSHLRSVSDDRPHLTSYVGSLGNAPRRMRERMHESLTNMTTPPRAYRHRRGPDWMRVMMDSKFSLVPRGHGRTAYHLMETLQLGLVPVVVYTDLPWIPYGRLLTGGDRPLAYTSTVEELPGLIRNVLSEVSVDDLRERERRIVSLLHTHFTMPGVMHHIDAFLWQDDDGALESRPMPTSIRDE